MAADASGRRLFALRSTFDQLDAATGQIISSVQNSPQFERLTPDGRYMLRVHPGTACGRRPGYGGTTETLYRGPSLELVNPSTMKLVSRVPLKSNSPKGDSSHYRVYDVACDQVVLMGYDEDRERWKSKSLYDLRNKALAGHLHYAKGTEERRSTSFETQSLVLMDEEESFDGALRIYDQAGQLLSTYELASQPKYCYWQPVLYSPGNGSLIGTLRKSEVAFENDGTDGAVTCWDSATRALKWTWRRELCRPTVLALSPDGRNLAVGGEDLGELKNGFASAGLLVVIDAKTGKAIVHFDERTARDAEIAGQMIKQGKTRFRTARGRWRAAPVPGDSGEITCLAWSPDGKYLYAGYSTGIIKKWRLPLPGKERQDARATADVLPSP